MRLGHQIPKTSPEYPFASAISRLRHAFGDNTLPLTIQHVSTIYLIAHKCRSLQQCKILFAIAYRIQIDGHFALSTDITPSTWQQFLEKDRSGLCNP